MASILPSLGSDTDLIGSPQNLGPLWHLLNCPSLFHPTCHIPPLSTPFLTLLQIALKVWDFPHVEKPPRFPSSKAPLGLLFSSRLCRGADSKSFGRKTAKASAEQGEENVFYFSTQHVYT